MPHHKHQLIIAQVHSITEYNSLKKNYNTLYTFCSELIATISSDASSSAKKRRDPTQRLNKHIMLRLDYANPLMLPLSFPSPTEFQIHYPEFELYSNWFSLSTQTSSSSAKLWKCSGRCTGS